MKALVLTAPCEFNYDIAFPDPVPGPGEVLVKVRACGICGSDIHGMDGRSGRRQMPIVMGHEAAGEIVALGEGVTDWQVGERVTFDSTEYRGSFELRMTSLVALLTTWALVRKRFLPIRKPVPDPPEGWPASQGSR